MRALSSQPTRFVLYVGGGGDYRRVIRVLSARALAIVSASALLSKFLF